MKILHINEHAGVLGGAERYLHDLCGALAEQGCDQAIASSSESRAAAGAPAVRLHTLPPSYGLRSGRLARQPLLDLLAREAPDIIHLHNTQYFLGPMLHPLLRAQAAVVQTVHDTRLICPRWYSKTIPRPDRPCLHPLGTHCFRHGCYPFHFTPEGRLRNLEKVLLVGWELRQARRVDRVLAGSRYLHDQLVLNGIPTAQIRTIPLFVSMPAAAPAADKQRRVLYAGRVDESKGIREFLACLASLSAEAWTADVAGAGPFLEEARALAARHGLADRVVFHGQVAAPDLIALMRAACVMILPSRVPESFGLAGLEALACGTPVVAFNAGGLGEWLEDGVTGFRVPWGDVTALAGRVREVLTDRALAARMGRQGQLRAAPFTLERHVKQIMAVYREVARGLPRAGSTSP